MNGNSRVGQIWWAYCLSLIATALWVGCAMAATYLDGHDHWQGTICSLTAILATCATILTVFALVFIFHER